MIKHSCRTYFIVYFKSDKEVFISKKDEVKNFILNNFNFTPKWEKDHFILSYNDNYDVDVNVMLRVLLKKFITKEDIIKKMQEKFSVDTVLEIVPNIIFDSEEPNQCLSLDKDIIKFLYKSNTSLDLDYYVLS